MAIDLVIRNSMIGQRLGGVQAMGGNRKPHCQTSQGFLAHGRAPAGFRWVDTDD
jgi:hypothetical protein